MNEHAINRLRKKFIFLALISFLLVMIFMGGLVYLINLQTTRRESKAVLDHIIENDGDLVLTEDDAEDTSSDSSYSGSGTSEKSAGGSSASSSSETSGMKNRFSQAGGAENPSFNSEDENLIEYFQRIFSYNMKMSDPDERYATRYMAVLFDQNDDVEDIKMNYIASVDDDEAVTYARTVRREASFGSIGGYYYEAADRSRGGVIVVFLDKSESIVTSRRILYTVMALLFIGAILSFFLLRAFSFRMVQPEIENAEKQKQFITNASHELKTPLSVIRANTEVEMMMNGENEWNQSTMRQVDHMTGLINNLVAVSRAEEREDPGDLEKINVSEVISDTCRTFEPVASQDKKKFTENITPDIVAYVSESLIRQLAGLLIDNAIKYCDDGGEITVSFNMVRHVMHLDVSNQYAAGAKVDYRRFFDRFYREDSSHRIDDRKKGGYGVGLSIAMGIVHQYEGDINVSWKNGIITFACTLKEPAEKAVKNAFKNGGKEAAEKEIRERIYDSILSDDQHADERRK